MWWTASATLALLPLTRAFYLPGTAPTDYKKGDPVQVFVNVLNPKTGYQTSKLKSLIDYDYYNDAFHFCRPDEGIKSQPESLGSILFGDRIFNSRFKLRMLEDEQSCMTLCTATVPAKDAKFINERIKQDYAINMLVDQLPAAEPKRDSRTDETFYDIGFNLGNYSLLDPDNTSPPTLNTHYEFTLQYHTPDRINYRVVGVIVWPSSDASLDESACMSSGRPLILSEESDNTVRYTYTVKWEESKVRWATRWDNYLHVFDPKIHWLSLANSFAFAGILCAMVSMILWRNVARDISRYNAMDLSEDVQEDFGWKLVHGEVFRNPQAPALLAILTGNGAQLMIMIGVTLVFALFGFLSPSNRGSLASVMLFFWTLFGSVGGYVSSRVYASLAGENSAKVTFLTAFLLPAFVFAIFFLLNFFLVIAGSSGAVPFGTMLVIVFIWFAISAPLTFLGARFGRRHGGVIHPVRVNRIPRQIPPAPKHLRPWVAPILAGLLPFGAAFVELYFVTSSLFASRAYYAFGFLALTAIVIGLTTATITILWTYFMLCAEEYRWHWRSFLIGGGSSFWFIFFGFYFWLSRLSLTATSTILYLGYLVLVALLAFLTTGTIGFLASYWAVKKLYSSIRID